MVSFLSVSLDHAYQYAPIKADSRILYLYLYSGWELLISFYYLPPYITLLFMNMPAVPVIEIIVIALVTFIVIVPLSSGAYTTSFFDAFDSNVDYYCFR